MCGFKWALQLVFFIICALHSGVGVALADPPVPEKITYRGQTYPAFAQLDYLYRKGNPQYQDGGSCHVFAAVALFESACYRKARLSPDVSEAYFFYRHLRTTLEPMSSGGFEFAEKPSYFTGLDGGDTRKTLDRILSGRSIRSESEFPWYKISYELRATINALDAKAAIQAKQLMREGMSALHADRSAKASMRGDYIRQIKDSLDNILVESHGRKTGLLEPSQSGGYQSFTHDGQIRDCLKQPMKIREYNGMNLSLAMRLLSSGTPFICRDLFAWKSAGDGSKKNKGFHVTNVVGYRYNSRGGFNDNIEFRIRDSNYPGYEWGWNLNCDSMTWIE